MWYLNEQDQAQERSKCCVDLFDQFLFCGCSFEFLVFCYAGMLNVNLLDRAIHGWSFFSLFIHSVCVCVERIQGGNNRVLRMKMASFYTNRNIGGTKTIALHDSTITLEHIIESVSLPFTRFPRNSHRYWLGNSLLILEWILCLLIAKFAVQIHMYCTLKLHCFTQVSISRFLIVQTRSFNCLPSVT